MNIAIFTNTFTPHVGGVARSVEAFTDEYRKRGHRVLVVAPEFADTPENETDVIRMPAIQNFNASDFSVALPIPAGLTDELAAFQPDIIHAQHPFLLGMTAVRLSHYFQLPLVFTHHTLYEQYTHYVPGDSPVLKRFVSELATHYANLANQVFAPSKSIRDLMQERGVTSPIRVVPTGVRVERFAQGDGAAFRTEQNIPPDAFVVGHLGRLAPEKNLEFLANAVAEFVKQHHDVWCLIVGTGPSEQTIREAFSQRGIDDRLLISGTLQHDRLANALNAMNLFAFASKSETQGMVLTEAMAAGLPVVALDASGVREVVNDENNGRLLEEESVVSFTTALEEMYRLPAEKMQDRIKAARATAEAFSMERSAENALECYEALRGEHVVNNEDEQSSWKQIVSSIKAEWEILQSVTRAGDGAISNQHTPED